MATNPKRRQPKRRHAKTATDQNGDNQNGDTSKTATTTKTATRQNGDNQYGDNQNGACRCFDSVAVLDLSPSWIQVNMAFWLSPFWFVAVLTGYKSTQRFGEKSSWACRRFGFVAILETTKYGGISNRRGMSLFWLSPFWMCCRFGLSPF